MAGTGRSSGSAGKRAAGDTTAGSGRAKAMEMFRKALIGAVVLCLIAVLAFLALYVVIDIPDENSEYTAEQSTVLYADGKEVLSRFAVQKRDAVPLTEVSDHLENAVIAAENRNFYEDEGIDPKGILRAVFNNAQGEHTQGASTITQQYVKLLYLTQERTYTRKVKEAILALKIQRQMSKPEVLQGYLNAIYFGRGAYGAEVAAQTFFGTTAKKLSLKQSAMLAAVIKNPNGYDPENGKAAKQALKSRYAYVLDSMADMGEISEGQAAKASRKLPDIVKTKAESTYGDQKGHVLNLVRDQLARMGYTEDMIMGGGFKITTTFTKKAMEAAEEGVLEARPDGFGDKELHVGVASVEPCTGAVRGIYGGQDFLKSQINWAASGTQAGSTFKAFALAAAIKDGLALTDTFDGNSPYYIGGEDFENQGGQDYGTVSMIQAAENSINTAFMNMAEEMGNANEDIIQTANDMGIPAERGNKSWGFPTKTPGLNEGLGLQVALGTQSVSPINMANGYATIACDGEFTRPTVIERIEDATGTVVYERKDDPKQESEQAIEPDIAADVSYALEQVVKSGSGTAALALGRPAAGKTGTATNTAGDVTSAWFSGFTPQLATAVAYSRGNGVGKLDGWLPSYFGGEYPAETWTAVMTRAMEGLEEEELADPVYVDLDSADGVAPPPPPPPPEPEKTKKSKPKPEPEPTKTKEPEPTRTPKPDPTTPTKEPDPCQQPNPPASCSPEPDEDPGPLIGGQGRLASTDPRATHA